MKSSQPRVALVYDRLNSNGGAEKVLQELHEVYPQAPLYTSVYDFAAVPWTKGWDVRTSWLQRFPFLRSRHRLLGWVMPLLFESFDFSDFDVVISITSEAAKSVITKPSQLHVCYMLTPTRYLWSHREWYLGSLPSWLQGLARWLTSLLQKWDLVAATRPDIIIPISALVGERVREFYHREPELPIYPPVQKVGDATQSKREVPFSQYIFTWGRHVSYKRFDMVICASVKANIPLLIAGVGPETDRLKNQAKELGALDSTVVFVGELSQNDLAFFLEHAAGAVFPQQEDFGITCLEAQLHGCPVIVQKNSGASELLSKSTAVFLERESCESIEQGIQELLAKNWSSLDIQRQAQQYAGARFQTEWRKRIDELWNEKAVQNRRII